MVSTASALRSLWRGSCAIYGKAGVMDERTGRTVQADVPLFSALPCRLSYRTKAPVSGGMPGVGQEARLFLARDVRVPEGCRIQVTQNGVTEWYCQSGPAAVYMAHQEIPVELERRYA